MVRYDLGHGLDGCLEPLPPNRSSTSTFSPGRDEYSMSRAASSTGFSVKWIMRWELTFLTFQRPALRGPRSVFDQSKARIRPAISLVPGKRRSSSLPARLPGVSFHCSIGTHSWLG